VDDDDDDGEMDTTELQGGQIAEYDGYKSLTLNSMADLPFYARSLTPHSMAMEPMAMEPMVMGQIDQEPVLDLGTLTSGSISPDITTPQLSTATTVSAQMVSEIICPSISTIAVEQEDPLNSKTLPQTKTHLTEESTPVPKQPTQPSTPAAKPAPAKPAEPKVIKPKVSEPVKPAPAIPSRNPPKASTIPKRIYSEIAHGSSSTSKSHAASQVTTLQVTNSPVTDANKIIEQGTDTASTKVSGQISFLPSMNDECTVENSMYPFKLVLSPLEERPLEKGLPPPISQR
jgi:hypothetical protein